jgi:hypothetical protein
MVDPFSASVIGLVAVNTGLNIVAHSSGIFTRIERFHHRLWYSSVKVTKLKNEPIYRFLTQIIDKYSTNLDHKEMITLSNKWDDDKEQYFKTFWIPEYDSCLTIRDDEENLYLFRTNVEGDEGYVIYAWDKVIMDTLLFKILTKVGMNGEDIKRLVPNATQLNPITATANANAKNRTCCALW